MSEKEMDRVVKHSQSAHYGLGVMYYTTRYCGLIFKKNMIPNGSVLELGPAEGDMTDILYPNFSEDYTVVDGYDLFVKGIQERYPKVKGHVSLFEDFELSRGGVRQHHTWPRVRACD